MDRSILVFIAIVFFSIKGYAQTGVGATPSTVAGIGPGKFEVTGVGDFTLKVKGDSYTGFGVQSFRESSSDHAIINLFGARGTMASPSSLVSGDAVSTISTRAYAGSGYTPITSIQSFYTGTNKGVITFSTNSGSSATSERVRIDDAGNVGIGSSSPVTGKLQIESSANTQIGLVNTSVGTSWLGQSGADLSFANEIGSILFKTNATYPTGVSTGNERMRITNTGNVGIGTSSPNTKLHVQSSDPTTVYIESTVSDNYGLIRLNANTSQNWVNNWHELIVFEKQGVQMGNIGGASNGTAVTYGSNSDYRLKRDYKDFNAINIVNRIKAYDFAWKADSSRMYGFIAHELQKELPYAVSGLKDQVDKEGKIIPQTVDYGKLTPILLKAIQEQDEKLDKLQRRIKSLELLLQKKHRK